MLEDSERGNSVIHLSLSDWRFLCFSLYSRACAARGTHYTWEEGVILPNGTAVMTLALQGTLPFPKHQKSSMAIIQLLDCSPSDRSEPSRQLCCAASGTLSHQYLLSFYPTPPLGHTTFYVSKWLSGTQCYSKAPVSTEHYRTTRWNHSLYWTNEQWNNSNLFTEIN